MSDNIKFFDSFTAIILDEIYKKFPLCIDLYTDEVINNLSDKIDTKTQTEENLKVIFSETMSWLSVNDFISYKYPTTNRPARTHKIEKFLCITLSLKGLNLLKSPIPETIKDKTVGNELVALIKEGSIKKATEIVTSAILDKYV